MEKDIKIDGRVCVFFFSFCLKANFPPETQKRKQSNFPEKESKEEREG